MLMLLLLLLLLLVRLLLLLLLLLLKPKTLRFSPCIRRSPYPPCTFLRGSFRV